MSNSEYNNMTAGGSPCNYSSLGSYNDPYSMGVKPQGRVPTAGAYIVPQWDAISYDSLIAKVPSCSGYSNIDSAYGKNAGNCNTQYSTMLCSQPSK